MKEEEFGPVRAFLWPIYKSELKYFLPLLFIFFCVGFNYSIMRAAKDALVVTAPQSGAEALPFLKVWVILPMALLFTFIFTRVSNYLRREYVFYTMMAIFLVFLVIFTFVLYPLRDQLHPHTLADSMQQALPVGLHGLVAIFRNWTFTVFYIMAEMWSTLVLTILCWGFVNETTTVQNAKRHYGLLGIGVNCSGIAAGQVSAWLSHHTYNPNLPFGTDAWGQSLVFLNVTAIVLGLICMGIFRWLHKRNFGYSAPTYARHEVEEIKMGIRKNFAYLARSKYLLCIAVIVIAFNLSLTLVEVTWKDQVKQLHSNPNDFNAYMGNVLTVIGVLATLTSIFISGNLIRRLNWTTSAMITPVILLITGAAFFAFILFADYGMGALALFFGTTPLAVTVFMGSLQNCFSRASKFTLFDGTKELSFIPLSNECKLKGKAAIDGIGSRLGKSGGSILYQGLLIFCGTISGCSPYIGFLLLIVIGAYIVAVRSLGRQFNALTQKHEKITIPDTAETKEQAETTAPAQV